MVQNTIFRPRSQFVREFFRKNILNQPSKPVCLHPELDRLEEDFAVLRLVIGDGSVFEPEAILRLERLQVHIADSITEIKLFNSPRGK